MENSKNMEKKMLRALEEMQEHLLLNMKNIARCDKHLKRLAKDTRKELLSILCKYTNRFPKGWNETGSFVLWKELDEAENIIISQKLTDYEALQRLCILFWMNEYNERSYKNEPYGKTR